MEAKTYNSVWLGLNSYTEADQERFFGRDKEIIQLQDCIIDEPLCTVFGPSGVGKTSLLLAGVLPQLRTKGYMPVYIRLDHNTHAKSYTSQIIDAFLLVVQKYRLEIKETCAPISDARGETLWEWFHRHEFQNALKKTVYPVLVFDQFEEIFTLGMEKEASEKWFDDLSDLCSNSVPEVVADDMADSDDEIGFPLDEQSWRVVICLREDFLPRLEERTAEHPVFSLKRFSVSPLGKEQALEAVLKAGKNIVNEQVAKAIVGYVGGTTGRIETPLLSLFCARLDIMRQKKGLSEITVDLVESNKNDILIHFYDEAMGGLSDSSRDYLEGALLNQNGYRNPLQLEEAEQNGVSQQELDALVENRLLHVIIRDNVPWIEFSHDILAPVAKIGRERRKQKRTWEAMQKAHEQEKEEMQAKLKLQQRRVRRISILLVSLIVLMGTIVFFSWYFFCKEYVEYYQNFVKVWGIPKGIGDPLTLEQVRHRACSFSLRYHSRFTFDFYGGKIPRIKPSKVYRVDAVGRKLRPTINHGIVTYFGDKDPDTEYIKDDEIIKFPSSESFLNVCSWEFTYDKDKRVEREVGINIQNNIVWDITYENTTFGSIAHLNFPVIKSETGAEYVYLRYYSRPAEIERREYRNNIGEKVCKDNGAYGYAYYAYKTAEHDMTIEEHRLSIFGTLDEKENGIAIIERRYENNKKTSEEYFDSNRKHVAIDSGISKILWQYDNWGNKIKEGYFDINGNVISIIQWRYDDHGNMVEKKNCGPEGELVFDKQGVSITRWQYDIQDNKIEERYFGINNKPVADKSGVSIIKWEYRVEDRNMMYEKKSFLGIHGEPVADSTGVSVFYAQFRSNRVVFNRLVGLPNSGGIRKIPNKYGRYTIISDDIDSKTNICQCYQYFDSHGRVVKIEFRGIDNSPIANKDGVSIEEYEYIGGGIIKNLYGIPKKGGVMGEANVSRILLILDSKGNLIEKRLFDIYNTPIIGSDGASCWKYQYNKYGKKIQQDLFALPGSGGVLGHAYAHHVRQLLNTEGEVIGTRYFDVHEREVKRTPSGGFK